MAVVALSSERRLVDVGFQQRQQKDQIFLRRWIFPFVSVLNGCREGCALMSGTVYER
jgi:hypothetical protein